MARAAMANIITRTRRVIGDTPAPYVFTDDEIQDWLDQCRTEFRYRCLNQIPTYTSGGGGPYYYSYAAGDWGDWEEDAVLSSGTYATISPTTSDYHIGRWTFSTEPTRPVYITGMSYDIYGSGERILLAWAAKLKLEFDFRSDDQAFSRQQQAQALLKMANELGRRRRDPSVKMVRTDLAGVPDPSLPRRVGF